MAEEPTPTMWVAPGKWVPVEENENWCDICQKSTLFSAVAYAITIDGVEIWGKAKICADGKDTQYINLEGAVTHRREHRQVEMQ